MASFISPISLTAPGFYGVNTQDSPVEMDQRFALDATNCIVDKSGRIAARKGWVQANTTNVDLGTSYIECAAELTRNDGTNTTLVAGNNKLYKLASGALVTLTYGGGGAAVTITGSAWQAVTLNDIEIFFQSGHNPLIYDPAVSTTTYRRLIERSGFVGTPPDANCAISAYGRIWAADTTTDKNTVYWSDTLSPHVWSGGTAGSLNLLGVWPSGGDQIVAIAEHNNNLIIFGKKQILIYAGAKDPSTMQLVDTIHGSGCIARDTIQNTGTDIIFLSDSGVRSLMRTIQEKSAPMREISKNVNDDVQDYANTSTVANIKSGYSPVLGAYLLTFIDRSITYCFDMKFPLPDGSAKTTLWTIVPRCYLFTKARVLYFGNAGKLGTYTGYTDNIATYRMMFYTPWLDLGKPISISILKKIIVTLIGTQGQGAVVKWGFDYKTTQSSVAPLTSTIVLSEYNIAEYGINEWIGSIISVIPVSAGGSGRMVQIAIEAEVNGYAIGVQKIDVYTKEGRI